MTRRLLAQDAASVTLTEESSPGDEIVSGSPAARWQQLDEEPTVGLWSMSEGTARDTESDEVFVVLSGRGTLTFDDGEVVDLQPSTVVRLRAGERTTWRITEPLRKLFVGLG